MNDRPFRMPVPVTDPPNVRRFAPSMVDTHPSHEYRHTQSEIIEEMEKAIARLNPLNQIAAHIRFLSYGNMMQFARELTALLTSDNGGVPEEMADMLYKWAMSKLPENAKPAAEQVREPSTYHHGENSVSDTSEADGS